jgi:Cu(I)/Ag(I) efflux system membrane fusion protein
MTLERVPQARPVGQPGHEGHGPDCPEHAPPPGKVLAVPVAAVLDTGRRRVAYRQTKEGAYELVELKLGPRAEGQDEAGRRVGYFPVLAGLQPGDRVVVRGGFLLDSQRQIEGMPSLLYPQGQSVANLHAGHGEPPPKPPAGGGHKH